MLSTFAFYLGGCSLAIPALEKFTVHMAVPPLLLISVCLAYISSLSILETRYYCCVKKSDTDGAKKAKKKNIASHRRQTSIKVAMFVIQLIYPGLATRIFSIFRCRDIKISSTESVPFFNSDYNVPCHVSSHAEFEILAVIFMGLYVAGTPAFVLYILLHNKKHLHDLFTINDTAIAPVVDGVFLKQRKNRHKRHKRTAADFDHQEDLSENETVVSRHRSAPHAQLNTSASSNTTTESQLTETDKDRHRDIIEYDTQHRKIKYQFGALYSQYERDYYYFELVILLLKMTMTGAMCIVQPGTVLQILYAFFVLSIYMLVILKSAPFKGKM